MKKVRGPSDDVQPAKEKDARNGELPPPRQPQPRQHADRERQNDHVQEDLDGPRCHPKDIVVEAVFWVRETIEPAPLERHAVRQSGDRAAYPPSDHQPGRSEELVSEGVADVEDPVVHAQDAELGGADDREVKDRGGECQLEIEYVFGCVDVVRVGIFRDPETVWVDRIPYQLVRSL